VAVGLGANVRAGAKEKAGRFDDLVIEAQLFEPGPVAAAPVLRGLPIDAVALQQEIA
jgi:hypothetical protein